MSFRNEPYDQLKLRRYFSPDSKELEMQKEHLLFVYDGLKVGFPNQDLLAFSKFLGEAWTVENNYSMRLAPNTPIIWQAALGKEDVQLRVWGHVYAVSMHHLMRVDAIMDNTHTYIRRKRYVAFQDQPTPYDNAEKKVTQEAWVYFPIGQFKEEMLRGSVGATAVIHHGGKYFWEFRKDNVVSVN